MLAAGTPSQGNDLSFLIHSTHKISAMNHQYRKEVFYIQVMKNALRDGPLPNGLLEILSYVNYRRGHVWAGNQIVTTRLSARCLAGQLDNPQIVEHTSQGPLLDLNLSFCSVSIEACCKDIALKLMHKTSRLFQSVSGYLGVHIKQ